MLSRLARRSRLPLALATAAVTLVSPVSVAGAQAQPLPALPAIPGLAGLPAIPDVPTLLRMIPPGVLPAGLDTGSVGGAPAAPAAPVNRDVSADLGRTVTDQVNAWRVAHRLVPVQMDGGLAGTAQGWAVHLGQTNTVEHNHDFLRSTGGAENIVVAPTSCDAGCLVDLWKNSPGHNENLLDPGLRRAGVGVSRNAQGMLVVVQDYGY